MVGSPPFKVTVNAALPPSTAVAGSGAAMAAVTGSSSRMTAVAVVSAAARVTAPAAGPAVAETSATLKLSSASFNSSPVSGTLKNPRNAPAAMVTVCSAGMVKSVAAVALPPVVATVTVTASALRPLNATVNTAACADSSARSPLME